MNVKHMAFVVVAIGAATWQLGQGVGAQGASSPDDQDVASVKANLQESQKKLRQYQWIETTIISLKGEEKSRKQQEVYYGADGKLTKLPTAVAPKPQPAPSGGRGGRLKEKIVENKKDEMQDYMERAVKLIQSYVPPSPDLIQKAKDGGRVMVKPLNAGLQVELQAFVQKGDVLAINVDNKGRLSGVSVKTYLDKPEEAVTLDVRYGTLTDGTSYVAQTTLDAAAKKITVVIQNSGHRPLAAR